MVITIIAIATIIMNMPTTMTMTTLIITSAVRTGRWITAPAKRAGLCRA